MTPRKQDHLSVVQFAEAIGVAPITVRRWDRIKAKGKPHAVCKNEWGWRLYTKEQARAYKKSMKQ